MLIDTHAHLNFKAYSDDRNQVIIRCLDKKMKVINVGAALDTSQLAIKLAKENKNMYAAVGLHPIHVYDEEFKQEDYLKLIATGKVVAMGETGFDYYHIQESLNKGAKSVEEVIKKQEKIFKEHIKLAEDNDLALIVHGRNSQDGRNAYQDIYRVLKETKLERKVVHCFGGNLEEAKQMVAIGCSLGFTGIVTFDKTGVLEQIVKWIPEDRMLIETDAPYLAPVPYRGKRNEPAYVEHVAEKIAEIRAKTKEEIIDIANNNAIKLFKL